MGYYTKFKLTISKYIGEKADPSETRINGDSIIKQLRESSIGARCAFDCYGETLDDTKWYDSTKEMIAFSLKHPDILFKLEGEGEESGDIWISYFLNGKQQYCKGIVTFEEFNPEKLA